MRMIPTTSFDQRDASSATPRFLLSFAAMIDWLNEIKPFHTQLGKIDFCKLKIRISVSISVSAVYLAYFCHRFPGLPLSQMAIRE